MSEYMDKYGIRGSCTSIKFIKCKLCNKDMRHDGLEVKLHLKKKHYNYTIRPYYRRFVKEAEKIEKLDARRIEK
jgi:hypothetical protein